MSKNIPQVAMAVLLASLVAQASAGGYRLDVAMPSVAEALYRPGVERSARIAVSQVVNDQFERLYPPDQWWISINTDWSREEAGLRHSSSCALERRVPLQGSTKTMDPVLWDSAHGLMALHDVNYYVIGAVHESVLESCGRLVRKAIDAKSVAALPQIDLPRVPSTADLSMAMDAAVDTRHSMVSPALGASGRDNQ